VHPIRIAQLMVRNKDIKLKDVEKIFSRSCNV
jgi:hypothetical protein